MDVGHTLFDKIISLDNLLLSWSEFQSGKRGKSDVQVFERNLEDNLFNLHWELKNSFYRHQSYQSFLIFDPKLRQIHKATVRDRIVHHAVFRILYPLFDSTFIFDSYSCRLQKGTHKAVKRLENFTQAASMNYRCSCYVLKCDIRKFFASVDHEILKALVFRRVADPRAQKLIAGIIDSFQTTNYRGGLRGLPIGNLTSQLFANVYLHELDKFVKCALKLKYYIRYTDDLVIADRNKEKLSAIADKISEFLQARLFLTLHPRKIILRKFSQGIDFLGYVVMPYRVVLRTKTKNRMYRKVKTQITDYAQGKISRVRSNQTLQSYFGMLKHCRSHAIKRNLRHFIGKKSLFHGN